MARATLSISQSSGTRRDLPATSTSGLQVDMAVDHGHRDAVMLVRHQPGRVGAELSGQHAVVGTGRAAALHMAGHADAGLGAGHLLDLGGNAVGGRGVAGLGALGRPFLALHLGFLHRVSALGHRQDREVLARLGAFFHRGGHLSMS